MGTTGHGIEQFARLSSIKEVDDIPAGRAMVDILTQGHEAVVRTCRKVLKVAQEAGDESSASLASDRMRLHEKTAWMLRALNR